MLKSFSFVSIASLVLASQAFAHPIALSNEECDYSTSVDEVKGDVTVSVKADGAERFRVFEQRFGPHIPRLKKGTIASYLGIRPESLSRLLAKSADKAGTA